MLPRGRDEARFALELSILVCALGYSVQVLAAAPTAEKAAAEAGDVLWYVAAVSRDFGLPLSQVLYAATYAPRTRQI